MSKLLQLLRQLSPRQHLRLRDYLHSDYFNKNESVRQLYAVLIQEKADEMPKESVFEAVFGKEWDYQAGELNHLYSHLLELTIAFLGQEQLQAQPCLLLQSSLSALRAYPLEQHFQTVARQHERAWSRQPAADSLRQWEAYRYHNELDAAFLMQPRRVYDAHLQHKSNRLDAFYIAEKLHIACDMINRNIVINADYNCHLLPEIENILQQQPHFLEQPAVRIYQTILGMLRQNKDEDYQQLKQLIIQHIYDFSMVEIQGICDYAQNFCIRKINSGASHYYEEFLNLYKLQLQYNILYRSNFLEEWDYKNIVTTGIRLRDFDWTEQFIHRQRAALRPAVRENAYTYNLAAFYYATQQYREALQLLQNVEFTDLSYHLGAKIIQVKSYYELGEWAALDALADAFRRLVQRSRDLSDYRRQANLHFIQLTQKLAKLRERRPYTSPKKWQEQLQSLREKMQQLAPVANAEWLQEALEGD